MNRIKIVEARQMAYTLALAGGWRDNVVVYWAAVERLSDAIPLMGEARARGWIELWVARGRGCTVAAELRGPRTVWDPFYTV